MGSSEIDARLINWGRWLRHDQTIRRLGYPWKSPFVFSPSKGAAIADLDAEHIEWVISSLDVAGRQGFGKGMLYAYILRLEFAERDGDHLPPVGDRAKDVSRRFKRPCGERTYYYHLAAAKRLVAVLAEELRH